MKNSASISVRRAAILIGLGLASCAPQNAPLTTGSAAVTVAPTNEIRVGDYEAPTPGTIAGANTIATPELQALMSSSRPVVIDVLDGVSTSIPGAVALPGAGEGTSVNDALQRRFTAKLRQLTSGDLDRPIVIFCLSQTCWLSHNAVVRAVIAGHRNVYWYRGGRNAWLEAGLRLAPVQPASW